MDYSAQYYSLDRQWTLCRRHLRILDADIMTKFPHVVSYSRLGIGEDDAAVVATTLDSCLEVYPNGRDRHFTSLEETED